MFQDQWAMDSIQQRLYLRKEGNSKTKFFIVIFKGDAQTGLPKDSEIKVECTGLHL